MFKNKPKFQIISIYVEVENVYCHVLALCDTFNNYATTLWIHSESVWIFSEIQTGYEKFTLLLCMCVDRPNKHIDENLKLFIYNFTPGGLHRQSSLYLRN